MSKKTNIVIIGDFGKDLDDEHALVVAAGLQKAGYIKLLAVIGNLAPAEGRAAIAKGTLNNLGMSNVPVGVGLSVFEGIEYPYEDKVPYIDFDGLFNGSELMVEILTDAENKSITLVLQSGLSDASKLLREHEDLFVEKIKSVVIMGGVQNHCSNISLTGKFLQPDDANNVTYNWSDGVWLYARLQELHVPMVIITRNAAYGCQIPFVIYDDMEKTGNPVGVCLKGRQQPSLEHLWKAACAPENADIRGTLPPRCNREWFIDTFCDGNDPGQSVESIWSYTGCFNLYDPINLIAAIPEIRDKFFNWETVNVMGTSHIVIGVSPDNNGIKDEAGLREFMISMEVNGLR